MSAFYNEHDPGAAAWLRELVREGHIAPGVVDERDIQQLTEHDIAGFTQVHLFAGIGGWSHALRLAGWPDDRPVWTGSCPCQPFSSVGKRKGKADARHLWPDMHRLVEVCRPGVVFGEQVASKDGLGWLDGVFADLEGTGYACGAADLCAAGVGEEADFQITDEFTGDVVYHGKGVVSAPNIRQRLFWVAYSERERWERREGSASGRVDDRAVAGRQQGDDGPVGVHEAGAGGLADAGGKRHDRKHAHLRRPASASGRLESDQSETARGGKAGGVGDTLNAGLQGHGGHVDDGREPGRIDADAAGSTGATGANDFWSAFDLIPCRDGKARRVEPGTFPLAHGIPGRVGLLRGYGNAINPHVAAAFVAAYEAARGEVAA